MKSTCDISLKDFLNEEEACVFTTLGKDTLREARDLNKLPFHKYGRKIIYEKEHLREWVKSFELHINGKVKNRK